MAQFEIRFRQVDVLPTVKHFMDELDLFNLFTIGLIAIFPDFQNYLVCTCRAQYLLFIDPVKMGM